MAERRERGDILSPEFKVAAEIYKYTEVRGEKIWFTKLAKSLEGEMSQSTVMKSLRRLFDWGIVKAEFGETDKGRAGRLLYIAGESKDVIGKIYDNFWKDK